MVLDSIQRFVADPITNHVVSPIKRHASYAFMCDSKLQELQEQVEQLQNKILGLQQSVDYATRKGKEIHPNVTKWLTVAEKDMGEAEELIHRKDQAMNKCFFGCCPNLKTRYQLGKNAEKKAQAIGKLRNPEGLYPISVQPPLEQINLPSRVLVLNRIMDALKDPNLDIIGIYGIGGVGKATLAMEVQANALPEKLFEAVVVVTVSLFSGLERIQNAIAEPLGITFSVGEIPGRASQLRRRLENSSVLIILDDVWAKLDFNAIGIPCQGSSSCKIILTSRDRDLLSIEMGAQKVFPLEPLNEEESLSLLQFYVDKAKDPEFRDIASQIAKKCYGLPHLILIVARGLRYEKFQVWEHTLNQLLLGDEKIYKTLYYEIEASYDYLPGEEMKSFFLLCALVRQSNIQVQYLLTYSIGLGLFKHVHTVEDARNKALSIIAKLKSRSLLLDGDMVGCVKMHDFVRNCALNIASRAQHAFISTSILKSSFWPDRRFTRISLHLCNVSELPARMNHPKTEFLLLFTEDKFLQVPDSFFVGLKNLKVVDLTGMPLLRLPSSIGLLTNLQTLCLHRCQLDDVSILGELINLEFLSFAFSNLVELPREIEHLTRLKLLDLNGCSNLQAIPPNVLSKLSLLEELYVLNSFVGWNSEENANITELDSLSHLSTLKIEIQDPTMIPRGFGCFSQLRRYKISIGNGWVWKGQYMRARTLKLKVEAGVPLENGIEFMLKNCEDLYLDGVRSIESLFYEGFPLLKHMHVQNDYHIEYLIRSTSQVSPDAFPALESLNLSNLPRLKRICWSQPRTGNFGELQILKISNCDKLTILLSFSLRKCLLQLRELEVESCKTMEAVVGEGIEDVYHNNRMIEFTQLRFLKLKNLPNLTGFCKLKEEGEQMGLLFNTMVSFPKLTSLEVNHMRKVKCLFNELDHEGSSYGCFRMFPALQSLYVTWMENLTEWKSKSDLPRLESICRSQLRTGNFKELQILKVGNCDKLTVLLSYPLGECLHQLQELEVESCERMEGVGEGIEDVYQNNGVIEFSQMRSLRLKKLPNLIGFCKLKDKSEQMGLLFSSMVSFPNLTSLEVNHMRKVKCLFNELYHEGSSNGCFRMFPALQSLSVTWMENLTEWKSKSDSKKDSVFPCLENVSIQYCPKLTHLPMSDPSKLVKLEMKHCEELIPIIGKKPSLASLAGLSIIGCPKLTDLQISPQSVRSFNELSVCKCEWLIRVPQDLQKVGNLTSLEIYCCTRLRYFPEDVLSKLMKLKRLSVGSFSEELDDFQYLNRIKDLHCLEELEIWGSDFFGREMHSLPRQVQHLSALKLLKIVGFTTMESLPEWLTDVQSLCSLSLDNCWNLESETTVRIIQKLLNLSHLSVSSCPVLQRSESEWLQPLRNEKINIKFSHVSKVKARLGY